MADDGGLALNLNFFDPGSGAGGAAPAGKKRLTWAERHKVCACVCGRVVARKEGGARSRARPANRVCNEPLVGAPARE